MTDIAAVSPDIRGYLNQLDETLKTVLLGLSGSVGEVRTVLERNTEVSEESNNNVYAVAVKIRDEQKEKFDELKSDIVRAATEVTEECKAYTDTREDAIVSSVEHSYLAKSDFGDYESETASTLEQHANSIALTVESVENINSDYQDYKKTVGSEISLLPGSIITEVSDLFIAKDELEGVSLEEYVATRATTTAGGITEEFTKRLAVISDEIAEYNNSVSDYMADITAYIRRGELEEGVYGIEIGRSDSNVKTRFLNDRISFSQGEVEVAYISDNNLYIMRAEILDYLRIGNSADGYFTFDVSQNGLEVRWSE